MPLSPLPGSDEALVDVLLRRLTQLTHAFRQVGPIEMGVTQSAVLGQVTHVGPLRMSDLASLQRVSLASMTETVARMEKQGWVTRRRDPDDGRAIRVAATRAGQVLQRNATIRRRAWIRHRLGLLDASEREALRKAVPALYRMLEPDRAVYEARPDLFTEKEPHVTTRSTRA